MAWGLIAVGLGLTIAGTAATIAGQEVSKRAQEDAMADEQRRQSKFRREAEGEFDQSLGKSGVESANEQIEEGTERRETAYQQAALKAPGVSMPVNRVVKDAGPAGRAGTINKAQQNAWAKVVGGSQAKLGAGGDWLQNQNVKNARTNQKLAVIGNKAQGSADVSRIEVAEAGNKGEGLGQIGQLLSAAGMLVGGMGAVGGAAAGTAGAATTAGTAGGAGTMASQNAWAAGMMTASNAASAANANAWSNSRRVTGPGY